MNSKAFSLKPQRKYSIITKLKYNLKTMNSGWTITNQASQTAPLLPNQSRVSVPLKVADAGSVLYIFTDVSYVFSNLFSLTDVFLILTGEFPAGDITVFFCSLNPCIQD
jgi:hypothetical protein